MPDVALLGRATRAKTLPVMLAPVAVGAALAWNRGAVFSWTWFAVTLGGAAALQMGASVINDYFDARTGVDKLARIDRTSIATGSGAIESGKMSARGMLGLAVALFAVALVCGATLAVARGLPVLAMGAAGAILAWQYPAPPLRLGYRGRGLGEVAIFVAFGLLPVAGAYYVQARRLDADALLAGVVPGLFITLTLYHHHFLHWRADKAVGKMTPVVVLGLEVALVVSGIWLGVAYAVLVVEAVLGVLPVASLLALLTAVPLAAAWSRARRDAVVQNCLNLLGATLGASLLANVVLVVSLVLAR